MDSKKCFKCGIEKPLAEFYKHSEMADGHLGKCKACTKLDVSKNRGGKIDYYRSYDRKRGNRQGREYVAQYRKKYPGKWRAHRMVAEAIRRGNLVACPCEQCGSSNTHAHHDDYSRPLNVRWLCPPHHAQWHDDNGPGLNP